MRRDVRDLLSVQEHPPAVRRAKCRAVRVPGCSTGRCAGQMRAPRRKGEERSRCCAPSPALAYTRAMAVLRIAKMGNPVLLRKAEPVADATAPEIRQLAAD